MTGLTKATTIAVLAACLKGLVLGAIYLGTNWEGGNGGFRKE